MTTSECFFVVHDKWRGKEIGGDGPLVVEEDLLLSPTHVDTGQDTPSYQIIRTRMAAQEMGQTLPTMLQQWCATSTKSGVTCSDLL